MHLTPIGEGQILLEPNESLDPSRPERYLDALMIYLQRYAARVLIYDASALPLIDAVYYAWLQQLARLCRLGGQQMIVAGISPTAAFGLARFLSGPPPFSCALSVDHARQHRD